MNLKINELKLGQEIKSKDLYGSDFTEIVGEDIKLIGISYHFVGLRSQLMQSINIWHKSFDPSDYKEDEL